MESHFNDRLIYDKNEDIAYYYTDLNKKYKFYTNRFGFKLLLELTKIIKKMLSLNKQLIENKGLNYHKTIKKGKMIYKSKVNLKSSSVTWSESEYNNLGLQSYYLKLKSFQRFVECWSLLERCGSLNPPIFINQDINVCSIGGGPGFECIAFENFYKKLYPNARIKFYVLDIIRLWENYVNVIGDNYEFIHFDIFKDELFEKINKVDYILLFNVMHNYMLNKIGLEIVNKYVNNVRAVLINDRGRNINKMDIIKKKINIIKVFDDDRQMVLSKFNFKTNKNKLTFPNNPYLY